MRLLWGTVLARTASKVRRRHFNKCWCCIEGDIGGFERFERFGKPSSPGDFEHTAELSCKVQPV